MIIPVKARHLPVTRQQRPSEAWTKIGLLEEPAVIMTEDGAIVAWYLPDLLTLALHEDLMEAARKLQEPANKKLTKDENRHWRTDVTNHVQAGALLPGTIDLSPGYHNQGGVSLRVVNIVRVER